MRIPQKKTWTVPQAAQLLYLTYLRQKHGAKGQGSVSALPHLGRQHGDNLKALKL